MRVFLTGGTGYLGGHVAEALSEGGHTVIALVRDRGRARSLIRMGAEVVEGDLLDSKSWVSVLERVEALVHTAAKVESWARSSEMFDRVNVDAAVDLVERAHAKGVARVVVASSLFALGPSTDRELCEDDRKPELHPLSYANDYVRTKALAARKLWEIQARGNPAILVYPTVLLGPGNLTPGNHTASVISDIGRGKLPGLIGDGQQVWNLVPVRAAAAGCVSALEKGTPGGHYILGGEHWTQRKLVERTAELFGVRAPLRELGTALPIAVAAVSEGWARLRGRPPELTRGEIRLYDADWKVSSAKAVRELGYDPGSVEKTVQETVNWIRSEVWPARSGEKP